jgi:hypothetical protein
MTTWSFFFAFSIDFSIESFNLLLVNIICVINLQFTLHSLFFSKKSDALDFWVDEIFRRLLFWLNLDIITQRSFFAKSKIERDIDSKFDMTTRKSFFNTQIINIFFLLYLNQLFRRFFIIRLDVNTFFEFFYIMLISNQIIISFFDLLILNIKQINKCDANMKQNNKNDEMRSKNDEKWRNAIMMNVNKLHFIVLLM